MVGGGLATLVGGGESLLWRFVSGYSVLDVTFGGLLVSEGSYFRKFTVVNVIDGNQ